MLSFQEMYKQTGVSWNKRYKKGYGGINKVSKLLRF